MFKSHQCLSRRPYRRLPGHSTNRHSNVYNWLESAHLRASQCTGKRYKQQLVVSRTVQRRRSIVHFRWPRHFHRLHELRARVLDRALRRNPTTDKNRPKSVTINHQCDKSDGRKKVANDKARNSECQVNLEHDDGSADRVEFERVPGAEQQRHLQEAGQCGQRHRYLLQRRDPSFEERGPAWTSDLACSQPYTCHSVLRGRPHSFQHTLGWWFLSA